MISWVHRRDKSKYFRSAFRREFVLQLTKALPVVNPERLGENKKKYFAGSKLFNPKRSQGNRPV